jgi:hypothetical protein
MPSSDQLRVIVEPVVNRGVTPADTAIVGDSEPDHRILPAPALDVPTEK